MSPLCCDVKNICVTAALKTIRVPTCRLLLHITVQPAASKLQPETRYGRHMSLTSNCQELQEPDFRPRTRRRGLHAERWTSNFPPSRRRNCYSKQPRIKFYSKHATLRGQAALSFLPLSQTFCERQTWISVVLRLKVLSYLTPVSWHWKIFSCVGILTHW